MGQGNRQRVSALVVNLALCHRCHVGTTLPTRDDTKQHRPDRIVAPSKVDQTEAALLDIARAPLKAPPSDSPFGDQYGTYISAKELPKSVPFPYVSTAIWSGLHDDWRIFVTQFEGDPLMHCACSCVVDGVMVSHFARADVNSPGDAKRWAEQQARSAMSTT